MGSDSGDRFYRFINLCFSARSHMGSDRARSDVDANYGVSIHAPTWGATDVVERDYSHEPKFQSTLPHGERLIKLAIIRIDRCFNPRSHMGSDLRSWFSSEKSGFQSTLPHGERQMHGTITDWLPLFQSTLPHGERPTLLV